MHVYELVQQYPIRIAIGRENAATIIVHTSSVVIYTHARTHTMASESKDDLSEFAAAANATQEYLAALIRARECASTDERVLRAQQVLDDAHRAFDHAMETAQRDAGVCEAEDDLREHYSRVKTLQAAMCTHATKAVGVSTRVMSLRYEPSGGASDSLSFEVKPSRRFTGTLKHITGVLTAWAKAGTITFGTSVPDPATSASKFKAFVSSACSTVKHTVSGPLIKEIVKPVEVALKNTFIPTSASTGVSRKRKTPDAKTTAVKAEPVKAEPVAKKHRPATPMPGVALKRSLSLHGLSHDSDDDNV